MSSLPTKLCPYCYSDIPKPATVCRICGRDLEAPSPVRVAGFTATSSTTLTLGSTEPLTGPSRPVGNQSVPGKVQKAIHPELTHPQIGMGMLRLLCEARVDTREPAIRLHMAGSASIAERYDVTVRELGEQGFLGTHPDDSTLLLLTNKGKQYCEKGRDHLAKYEPLA